MEEMIIGLVKQSEMLKRLKIEDLKINFVYIFNCEI